MTDGGLRERYERMVQAHYRFVFQFLYWLGAPTGVAEDLTQETFLRAWQGLPKLRGDTEGERAWLAAIARRVIQDHVRKKRLETLPLEAAELLIAPGASTEEHVAEQDADRRLRAAVFALPEPYRTALVLVKIEALSIGEAARATGVPSGTVKWRVSRGLRILEERLGERSVGKKEAADGTIELRPNRP